MRYVFRKANLSLLPLSGRLLVSLASFPASPHEFADRQEIPVKMPVLRRESNLEVSRARLRSDDTFAVLKPLYRSSQRSSGGGGGRGASYLPPHPLPFPFPNLDLARRELDVKAQPLQP